MNMCIYYICFSGKEKISDYCQKHDLVDSVPDMFDAYQYWLYDDNKKIVFCYVPKGGSTKWKYVFLLLNDKFLFNDNSQKRQTWKQLIG